MLIDVTNSKEDKHGFTYFVVERAHSSEEITIRDVASDGTFIIPHTINHLKLWSFALLLPYINENSTQQFAIIQENWLKLRAGPTWSFF